MPGTPPWTEFEGEAFWTRLDRLYSLTASGPDVETGMAAFLEAQEEVLAGLLGVDARRGALRRERGSHSRAEYERAQRALDKAEAAIRRTADAMAWIMVNGQLWILRRLHTGEARPRLRTLEWQSVAAAARTYCDERPDAFALMSDLTSFIDIGDLFLREHDTVEPIEVKTGVVNEKIVTWLHSPTAEPLEALFAEHGDHAIQQAERVLKQARRLLNFNEVLRTGRGEEYGRKLRVFGDDPLPEDVYTEQLASVLDGTASRDWSIGDVDGCLLIGAYKGAAVFKSGAAFSAWVSSDPSFEGPTIDLRSALTVPLALPLHVRPALRRYAIPILRGDIRVLLRLALPLFGRLAADMGLSLAPMSKAETEKYARNAPSRSDVFQWKRRALGLSYRGATVAVGSGLLSRVFHNQMTPRMAIELVRLMSEATAKA